jgi:hypothetical protein
VKTFLREYWPWIVVPVVLVVGLLALFVFLGGDEGASPFVYNF